MTGETLGKVLPNGFRCPRQEEGEPEGGRFGWGLEERFGSAERREAENQQRVFKGSPCSGDHVELRQSVPDGFSELSSALSSIRAQQLRRECREDQGSKVRAGATEVKVMRASQRRLMISWKVVRAPKQESAYGLTGERRGM